MSEFTDLIPLPNKKKHQEGGPIHQKMGRILLYVIQKYAAERGTMHAIIYAAWKRLNEDKEFCEQLELNLPKPSFSIYDETHASDPFLRTPMAYGWAAGIW